MVLLLLSIVFLFPDILHINCCSTPLHIPLSDPNVIGPEGPLYRATKSIRCSSPHHICSYSSAKTQDEHRRYATNSF